MIKTEIDKKTLRKLRRMLQKQQKYVDKGFSRELKMTLADATRMAKKKAPIDTGNLRRSIGYDFINQKTVYFRALANYASFIEFGTRKMRAQPFFYSSLNRATNNLIERLKTNIKKNSK